ncbi:hypothetical protein [Mycolicibacterium arenosum]|uniref:Transposase n=1 Tax=Mycolicibacterium arenosum TaxID=2952157 RepID=A0ABT1MCB6_9MYCO|nr:hypothetical protein [Mycolicibacterium sp. CAU 1645]MCP9276811.1 hypothetical protein [Mycolicibacterium sp. CAU 1645]
MRCLHAPPGVAICQRLPAETDTTIATAPQPVVIGGDTHLDTVHLAVITDTGNPLSDSEFTTTPTG